MLHKVINWVIVGLGNPGETYALHRHNVGFIVLDAVKKALDAPKGVVQFSSQVATASYKEARVYLQKPMTYMNLSGRAVKELLSFYKLEVEKVIVIHDDLDLPLGKVKIKQGGSSGGHNGLKSLSESLGSDGYVRVRVGIGRPPFEKEAVVNYVLSPFSKAEKVLVEVATDVAVRASLLIVEKGAVVAMNEINGLV